MAVTTPHTINRYNRGPENTCSNESILTSHANPIEASSALYPGQTGAIAAEYTTLLCKYQPYLSIQLPLQTAVCLPSEAAFSRLPFLPFSSFSFCLFPFCNCLGFLRISQTLSRLTNPTTSLKLNMLNRICARMAELADALASGASGLTVVEVRVLFRAPIFL